MNGHPPNTVQGVAVTKGKAWNKAHWGIHGEGLQHNAGLTPSMGVLQPQCVVFRLLRELLSVLGTGMPFPATPDYVALMIACEILLISSEFSEGGLVCSPRLKRGQRG